MEDMTNHDETESKLKEETSSDNRFGFQVVLDDFKHACLVSRASNHNVSLFYAFLYCLPNADICLPNADICLPSHYEITLISLQLFLSSAVIQKALECLKSNSPVSSDSVYV